MNDKLKHLAFALALGAGAGGHQLAMAQSADGTWTRVATEHQSFTITGTAKTVRYGAGTKWVTKSLVGNGVCTNAFFGQDPIPGRLKGCDVFTPAQPRDQRELSHPDYSTLWNHQQINLSKALGLMGNAIPAKKIRIAVLDGGRTPHDDIGWARDGNKNVLAFDSVSEWGCITTAQSNPGFCAAIPKLPNDTSADKHGTHVMGIINGTHAQRGRFGVCPADICEVLSIKVTIGNAASVAAGINVARHHKADVINMSFNYGAYPTLGCNEADLKDPKKAPIAEGTMFDIKVAIDAALADGISIVNSAGNHGAANGSNGMKQNDVRHEFPGACPGVITAGASDQSGGIANAYSNHGSQVLNAKGDPLTIGTGAAFRPVSSLTLIAPGGGVSGNDLFGAGVGCPGLAKTSVAGVYSAHYVDSPAQACHRYLSGTSMAAPHVSAVIGLMQAARTVSSLPKLSPADVKNILMTSATDLAGKGHCATARGFCGSGLLNAYEAVRLAKGSGSPSAAGPCSLAPAGTACKLDAIAFYTDTNNFKEETVIAYGKMWKFHAEGTATLVGKDLRSIPRYAAGPCSRAPAQQACVIDSLTILNHPEYGYIESVSAYGHTWAFDWDGLPLEWSYNLFLNSVERYKKEPSFGAGSAPAIKPCQGSPYDACKFDTRTLVNVTPEYGVVVESIVANGYYFLYAWNGDLIEKNTLLSVARYANGPCKYRPANTVCTFDALDNKRVNGRVIEVITAYGRYWEFDTSNLANTAPINGTGGLIDAVARFR
jgi:subtilisin family serine protease